MKLFPPNRRLRLRAVVILVSVIVAIGFQFETARTAGTFTVNSLGDTSDMLVGNGICADAGGACTLRAAIEEANFNTDDADTINFSVTGTINLTGPLPIITKVTINGPGSSQLTVRRDTGGDYRIFFIGANVQGIAASLSGLTVTNGKTADGIGRPTGAGDAGGDGGGILSSGFGIVMLSDVVVTGNRTGNGGVSGSTTGGWGGSGGGIAANGTLILTNVTVSNNITGNGAIGQFGGSGGRGGGISFHGSDLHMTNCIVSDNTTGDGAAGTDSGASGGGGGDGGGIMMNGGGLKLTNVIVSGNRTGNTTSGGTGGHGGGLIAMPHVISTLDHVTFNNNTTGNGGGGTAGQGGRGGALENHSFMNIRNSTFAGNKTGNAGPSGGDSGGRGGAISSTGSLKIWNSTISGNSTDGNNAHGGGISIIGGGLSLLSSTVTGNAASSQVGNGIYRQPFFTISFGIANTIVAQNIGGPDASGDFGSLGGNLIGNADGATGFIASDLKGTTAAPINALLGPLADNGGPTQTHALLAGSPALDAGDNTKATDPIVTDQRGAARIADSLDAGTTATVDIGAYEFHQTLHPISDQTINEDTSLTLSFGLGDTGPGVTSVTASSTHQGLLPNANLVITGTGPVRTLKATPLANLSGSTTITITANYSGGSIVNSSFLLTVLPVNDAPTFANAGNQTVNEDAGPASINWATGISAGPGESTQTLSFVIETNSNPSLFSAGPSISSSGTLTFTPAANAFGTALLNVSLNDNGGTANGGQNQSAWQTLTITVNAVNDAPAFTKGADLTVAEDSGLGPVPGWATGISVGPANESQLIEFIVTNNTNASLFSSQPFISNSGTLSFFPAPDANGVADITVAARDSGGTANGGVDTSAPQTFRITVTPVNDAPLIHVPFFASTNQQTPLVFSAATFNAVSVTDVDSGANAITVSLMATHGVLTMSSKTGLTFSVGDGTNDATMTFSGTVTAINAALNGLTYLPENGFSGTDTIHIVSNDNGHTGAGGAKSNSTGFDVHVVSGGRFLFNTSTYGVNENGGTATITVLRGGGSAGVASVSASTAGGSATGGASCTAGVDYLPKSVTFTWGNGDTSPRQFTVSICNDSLVEGDETINLTLDSPTGTGSLGTPSTAVLTIGTDDGPVLLFDETTQEAIALDLVNLTRDPFSLTNPFNMSTDQRRRISLFVWQAAPLGSNELASVMATARDSEFRVYQLEVEALSPVPLVPGVTQVVVKLPDSVIGAPRELLVKVTVKGLTTNEAFIQVTPP